MFCRTCGQPVPNTRVIEQPLTERQRRVLTYVHNFIQEHGYSPTIREISDALGYRSVSAVHAHLRNLQAKGCLSCAKDKPRTLRVLAKV